MPRNSESIRVPLELIGDFPPHWKPSTLAEVCKQVTDGTHDSPKPSTSGFPLVTGKCITGGRINLESAYLISDDDHAAVISRSRPEYGDILFANIGNSIGELARVETKIEFSIKNVALFKPGANLESQFLKYYLLSPSVQSYIRNTTSGSAQPFISLGNLRAFPIPVPPLPEQKRIAHILGTLDDKIELNRRMNATLEAIAQALFKSWFVDFDPVRAKASGESEESISQRLGLSREVLALFPDRLVESELGEIPEGWQASSVYEIAHVIYGAPFASSKFNNNQEGKPLIRIRDLPTEAPSVFTQEVHPKGFLVQPGHIVVGMDGEFRAYLWGGSESWLNQRVCVFLPKPQYSPAFVRNSIMRPLHDVESTETATTVIHLGKGNIDRFKIVTPSLSIASNFSKICQPLYDKIVANKINSRTLAELRDSLLPKLLSGELSVSEANSQIEAVT